MTAKKWGNNIYMNINKQGDETEYKLEKNKK